MGRRGQALECRRSSCRYSDVRLYHYPCRWNSLSGCRVAQVTDLGERLENESHIQCANHSHRIIGHAPSRFITSYRRIRSMTGGDSRKSSGCGRGPVRRCATDRMAFSQYRFIAKSHRPVIEEIAPPGLRPGPPKSACYRIRDDLARVDTICSIESVFRAE